MPWTAAARCDYARRGKRYSSDLSDREWALISPFLPEPRPVGRPRTTDLREVDLQDRDGAAHVLKSVRHRYPWLRHVFADGGYAGEKLKGRLRKIGRWTFQIIKRSDRAEGFEVLPRRWVMEQTFAWLGRCRRLAKDFEKSIASAEAWIFVANPRLLTRRLASYCYPS